MANSNDGFYLRLTLAILYRAGLDAANKSSPHCAEAREFLQSDFARFAHGRLLENVGVIDFAPAAYHLSALHTRSVPDGDGSRRKGQRSWLSRTVVDDGNWTETS